MNYKNTTMTIDVLVDNINKNKINVNFLNVVMK